MNGSHVAGSGVGAIAGVILAAAGARLGMNLTHADAGSIVAATMGIGLAVGHALGKAWAGPGVFPALRRGLFGGKAK